MSALFLDVRAVRNHIDRLLLDFPEFSEDAESLILSLESETDFNEVLTRIVRQERDAASFSEAIKSQEEALAERRARMVRRQQMFRQLMLSLLEASGQSKVVLPEATVSVSKGRLKTIVTDEAAIPSEYMRVTTSPDITKLGLALANGLTIPGVQISNGSPSISVRVK